MEPTEHIYPTLGVYVSELHAPVVTGGPRERVVRCRGCLQWDSSAIGENKTCFEWSDADDGIRRLTPPDGFCFKAEPRGGEGDAR